MWWEQNTQLIADENNLLISNIDANDLAKENGTPLYVYNSARIKDNYYRLKKALEKDSDREIRLHYAVKANPNPDVLALLASLGAWVDAVSPEEVELAIKTGFEKKKILFTGTNVSNDDIKRLMELNVRINIDSFSQLRRMAKLSNEFPGWNKEVSVRMNPGFGAGHHAKTITGGAESHGVPIKFGIEEEKVLDAYKEVIKAGLKPVGLHQHIGSGWLGQEAVDNFLATVDKTLAKAKEVTELIGANLDFVDIGGGPGIRYKESDDIFPVENYGGGIAEKVKDSGLKFNALAAEPGRYLVGDAGLLLAQVNTVEEKFGNLHVGVNSGFNHLLRPAMYGAHHEIINCSKASNKLDCVATVSGNLCETGDVFAVKIDMVRPEEGDILAFLNSGAYGISMASKYNSRKMPKEILI